MAEKIPVAAAENTKEGVFGFGSKPDAVLAAVKIVQGCSGGSMSKPEKKEVTDESR